MRSMMARAAEGEVRVGGGRLRAYSPMLALATSASMVIARC
jgi:hypothetical protein